MQAWLPWKWRNTCDHVVWLQPACSLRASIWRTCSCWSAPDLYSTADSAFCAGAERAKRGVVMISYGNEAVTEKFHVVHMRDYCSFVIITSPPTFGPLTADLSLCRNR